MKRVCFGFLAGVAFASFSGCGGGKPSGASGGSAPGVNPGASTGAPVAEDHAAEVKAALEEGIAAAGSGDTLKFAEWFSGMLVPDYEAWCKRTFGAENGASLARSLEPTVQDVRKRLREQFATIHRMQATEIRVVLVTPEHDPDTNSQDREVLAAMKEKFPLFSARFYLKGETRPTFSWGGFAFVEGRARWIGEVSHLK